MKNLINPSILNSPQINWGYADPNPLVIDLLRGENPYTPAIVQKTIKTEADKANFYPLMNNLKLLDALAAYLNINKSNLFLTNGSDDAIECIAKVFLNQGDQVVTLSPTFPTYQTVSQFMGSIVKRISVLDSSGQAQSTPAVCLSTTRIYNNIKKELMSTNIKLIWIANPNNPTGNVLLTSNQIEQLATQFPDTLFVIDECYAEFAGTSAVSLIKKRQNIVVIVSFSKSFGLAGLRFGCIAANEACIRYISRLQALQPFRVNRVAQAAALALLENPDEMKQIMSSFLRVKKDFEDQLQTIPQLKVWTTLTSFSFCELQVKSYTASDFTAQLAENGVLIKDCSTYGEIPNRFIRIGIPTRTDQPKVISAIKNIFIKQ